MKPTRELRPKKDVKYIFAPAITANADKKKERSRPMERHVNSENKSNPNACHRNSSAPDLTRGDQPNKKVIARHRALSVDARVAHKRGENRPNNTGRTRTVSVEARIEQHRVHRRKSRNFETNGTEASVTTAGPIENLSQTVSVLTTELIKLNNELADKTHKYENILKQDIANKNLIISLKADGFQKDKIIEDLLSKVTRLGKCVMFD